MVKAFEFNESKVWLGPAGTPLSNTIKGIDFVYNLGLNNMELEFVRGVKMSVETAKKIKEHNKNRLRLSIHAPYYINLCSEDKEKIKASINRILISCERAHYLNAKYVVFHPGYYGKLNSNQCYEMVFDAVNYMLDVIKENRWNCFLSPETTGKPSQFGSLDELIKLSDELNVMVCVDFAHLYARNLGKINYDDIFNKILNSKYYKRFKEQHSHFSGIVYTSKGEKNHIPLNFEFFKELGEHIINNKININIISESPITYKDALNMKKWLMKLQIKQSKSKKNKLTN